MLAPVAQFEWHLQTDSWEWESTVFDVYGVRAEDVVPSDTAFLSLKHPDDVRPRQAMMQMLKSGKARSYVHRVFREDGFVRLVNSSALVILDSRQRPNVMQGTIEVLGDWEHPLAGCDLANASDGVLMLCFRAQVPEAFADAFLRHSGSVERFVRQLGYPSVNADDVVQDVFERLHRNQGGFDARRGSLAAYLKWQARSRSIDRVRSEISRRNRELVDNEVATTQSIEDEVVSTLSRQCVRIALAGLDDDERVPIELAYIGGLSYCAVADFLELPEGTIKSRIRRGLRNLKASSDLVELMSD